MLTYLIAGGRSRDTLFFRDPSWAERKGIDVRLGCQAVELHTGSKKLRVADGKEISYDRALIATGSSPISLPIPGVETKGVLSLRNINDAEIVTSEGPDLREAVIVGGGFIGLKLACHLRERGVGVTVLEKEPKLAPRMFDDTASFLVGNKLRKHGIRVETDVEVTEFLNENGWVTGVIMKDGEMYSCQRVIQAVGVRPSTQFLADSGIDLQGGVLVNERMETNVPGIYAAGDVTMTIDSITSERLNNATWPAATRQGTVAGWNMAGGNRTYTHNFLLNGLNLFGLRVMAAGHPYYEEGSNVDVFVNRQGELYRKIVIRGGRVIGFLFVGDISGAGFLLSLMKRNAEISRNPSDLLHSRISLQDNVLPNLGYRHGELFTVLRKQ
jgi:NAD(P)H-nitrite reductase large subunit